MVVIVKPLFSVALYSLFFHFILMLFLFVIVQNYRNHRKKLQSYFEEANMRGVCIFILYYNNTPFVFFTTAYVYLLLLLSNQISYQALVNISIILFLVFVSIQKRNRLISNNLNCLKIISNFPILAVLTFSPTMRVPDQSFLFDFLFVFINLFKISLFGYEIVTKVQKKYIRILKQQIANQNKWSID